MVTVFSGNSHFGEEPTETPIVLRLDQVSIVVESSVAFRLPMPPMTLQQIAAQASACNWVLDVATPRASPADENQHASQHALPEAQFSYTLVGCSTDRHFPMYSGVS